MRPRFLADADFNQKIIAGLRRREPALDFQTAQEGGTLKRTDPEVLLIAAGAGRILVSHDLATMPSHFARFLQTHTSPGLVIVSQDLDAGAAIEDLLLIWSASDAEEWRDKIGFVPI